LEERLGKLMGLPQDVGEGLVIEVKLWIGQTVFGEKMGETAKELGKQSAADVEEDGGVGEEFEVHVEFGVRAGKR